MPGERFVELVIFYAVHQGGQAVRLLDVVDGREVPGNCLDEVHREEIESDRRRVMWAVKESCAPWQRSVRPLSSLRPSGFGLVIGSVI